MEKNFSLLRPFNLELAKAGEPVCSQETNTSYKFIDGPDKYGACCFLRNEAYITGTTEYMRMAPLTWIEGKPVYKGDVLYWKPENRKVTIQDFSGKECDWLIGTDKATYLRENLTWEPKVETKEYWYRAVLLKQWDGELMTVTVDSNSAGGLTEASITKDEYFVKFLSDRVYYRA